MKTFGELKKEDRLFCIHKESKTLKIYVIENVHWSDFYNRFMFYTFSVFDFSEKHDFGIPRYNMLSKFVQNSEDMLYSNENEAIDGLRSLLNN